MEGITKYLFWLGVILALITGILPLTMADYAATLEWIILILVIIGIIIGFLNVDVKETAAFYLSGIAFLVSYPVFTSFTAALTQLTSLWTFINGFLMGMAAMVAPAVVIVALKVLPTIMKD